MTELRLYQMAVLGALGLASFLAISGLAPGSPPREEVPVSARDNPGAWRPIYRGSTGYTPPSSSGGYDFGK